ncbi:MAG TPA: hypothetical protein PKD96_01210 [Candidatus Absconditabacterales bacterium]|nr:hypothetical protein [Candidatus Absconditabacterales bacterium]
MDTSQARSLLGELASGMNDEELDTFIIECKRISSIIMDFAEKEAQE